MNCVMNWKKIVATTGAILLSCVVSAQQATAAIVTYQQGDGGGFSDTDATFIASRVNGISGQGGTNFDGEAILRSETDTGTGGGVTRSLIRFSGIFGNGVGQIPAGSIINSATLTLSQTTGGFAGSNDTLSAFQVISGWDEGTVTWDSFNSGGVAGTDYITTALDSFVATPDNGAASHAIDILLAVQNWSANTSTNQGILIINPGIDGSILQSDEGVTPGIRPLLTVDYTAIPEPASWMLVASALGMMTFKRRRR